MIKLLEIELHRHWIEKTFI